jgi:L-2-hydroxyglutarate oxidase LhgO
LYTDIDMAIIGGGVVGCAVARELSAKHTGVFLFEKNPGVTKGENQSSRNSGVIHSGTYYDRETRPQKAALCVEGNRLLYEFCRTHRVPALRTGKLIVATTPEEDEILDLYLARAADNGVPEVRKISGQEVSRMEPNVVAVSALEIPSAGIVEPTSLVYRLHTLAADNGVHFLTGTAVTDVKGDADFIYLSIRRRDGANENVRAKVAVNAAGLEADRIARFLNPDLRYERDPVRGESYKFYGNSRSQLRLLGKNVYPTPEIVVTPYGRHFTVGIHLTPTFEDRSYPPRLGATVTVGPKVVPAAEGERLAGDRTPASFFAARVQRYFPGLKEQDLSWYQAGVQARLKDDPDFVIRPDPVYPHFIHLLGIDSPGLTASLAIGRKVAHMVEQTFSVG